MYEYNSDNKSLEYLNLMMFIYKYIILIEKINMRSTKKHATIQGENQFKLSVG